MFSVGATVNNVSTTILVHVSWHMRETLVSVTQECIYWVLGHTDVQLYTMWLTFWAPDEGTTATCPRWECEQDRWEGLPRRVSGGNWASTLCTWQGTCGMRQWCPERWDREGNPPVATGISFQGVSHPGWARRGLGNSNRAKILS